MKQVRLLKLELTNYRNIEHEVYMFDGSNAKIVGENRIGKTNTLEAIYFLLSNYLLDGGSDLSAIKPLGDTTKEVRVEGTFKVDEREIKLGKTYGEKWVKQRGTDTLTMQGHYEEYFVNGIKQSKEKDYYELLQEYFGIRNDEKGVVDNIQMLTNPLYLGNLGEGDTKQWQMLRTFIVKLIGDVDDEEIFAKAPQTLVIKQDLLNALGKTDQLKKMYSNDIDTLNNQLLGFDSQVELLEATSNPSDDEVEKAKAQVEAISGKILELKNNSGKDSVVEQLEKEVFELSKQIVEKNQVEFAKHLEQSKQSDEAQNNAKIRELNTLIDKKVNEYTNLKIERNGIENKTRAKQEIRENLVKSYKENELKIKSIDSEVISECPTCHRPFSEKEIALNKDTILKDLIAMKDKIVSDGKQVKLEQDDLVAKGKELFEKENALDEEIAKLRKDLNELNGKTFERKVFEESDELKALRDKEKALKDELTTRKEKVSEKASDNYDLVMKLESDKLNAQKVIDDRGYYERQMTLLANVKSERKNVSNKLIETEQKQEALKTYLYTKLRLLDEHIAKVFGKLRFQLIKENINGGFDPVCKPYIYDIDKDVSTDVLWKSGSKSEKIITGIAIVEAIKKELDLTELPYLFDEGGEISNETLRNKFKTNAQIICVRVEDNINKPIVVKF